MPPQMPRKLTYTGTPGMRSIAQLSDTKRAYFWNKEAGYGNPVNSTTVAFSKLYSATLNVKVEMDPNLFVLQGVGSVYLNGEHVGDMNHWHLPGVTSHRFPVRKELVRQGSNECRIDVMTPWGIPVVLTVYLELIGEGVITGPDLPWLAIMVVIFLGLLGVVLWRRFR